MSRNHYTLGQRAKSVILAHLATRGVVPFRSWCAQEQTEVAADVGQEVAPRVEINFFYGLNRGTGTEGMSEKFFNFKSVFLSVSISV